MTNRSSLHGHLGFVNENLIFPPCAPLLASNPPYGEQETGLYTFTNRAPPESPTESGLFICSSMIFNYFPLGFEHIYQILSL